MRHLSSTTSLVLIANNPAALAARAPHATVEAEYGDALVEGSLLTMAHHGPRTGQPAPCSYGNETARLFDALDVVEIGVSHLDLDTVGGIMAIYGCKQDSPCFWSLAEFIDLNGVHKVGTWDETAPFSADEKALALQQLSAWIAWEEANKVYAPRDGSVADITEVALRAVAAMVMIFVGESGYMAAGRAHVAAERTLNVESFVSCEGGVVLRRAPSDAAFVNHLYITPKGQVAKACVGFNPADGSVTVSYADGVPAGAPTARELVQYLWGDLAGGRDGIAGSPRGERLTFDAAEVAAALLSDALKGPFVLEGRRYDFNEKHLAAEDAESLHATDGQTRVVTRGDETVYVSKGAL
jgi:hypothetical protein